MKSTLTLITDVDIDKFDVMSNVFQTQFLALNLGKFLVLFQTFFWRIFWALYGMFFWMIIGTLIGMIIVMLIGTLIEMLIIVQNSANF